MVFQDYHLLNDRNVFHNVALPLHVIGCDASEISYRVEDALDMVGFEGKRTHYPHELSGGEKQRVTLARAIVKEPSLILADEPTGNLDPVAAFELVQLLETINNNGTTILMASHNYNLIKGRGRRIIELKEIYKNNGLSDDETFELQQHLLSNIDKLEEPEKKLLRELSQKAN